MTEAVKAAYPTSPCVQICTLDDANVCVGCYRTLEEIGGWARMSPDEQRSVIRRARERGALARESDAH